ncbi:Phenolic glucoside malonyltransferase 2 [Cardamine amara subsp. amara]|uniref:Phenolic glucoside malonyltransferase 2 n=1 Tax=Cardamine amara subsp. amara TaxID=228776 RepID=A0ABD1C1W7_CARAN
MTLRIIETARVTPAVDSDSVLNSANSLTIPLTFFDLPWLLFHPVKRVFFYKLTESTREHFNSIIVPKLKLSLSLVLRNYLPLTGCVTWNPNEPKPSIVVTQNDAVLVTIAETNADFSHLSGYGQRPVSELHALLPKLPVSDDSATAFSIQITLFPNQGFTIGVAAHHAVLDGKTSSMFIKTWACICKQQLQNIPETLTPSYDRPLIKDMIELDENMIEMVRSLKGDKTNIRSLTPFPARELGDDVVLATLVLSRDDIKRLRERVKSVSLTLHLSTFVIAYAYTWTCFVKARGGNRERSVSLLFVGDFRERLDPKLPVNYFGNCVFPAGCYNRKAVEFMEEKGFVTAVEIISDLVKGLSSRKVETIAESFAEGFSFASRSTQFGTIAGSTRFGIYESDFGWGRPVKVDIVSIDQGEAISMAERRDESGGVEIGMCLKKSEMDMFLPFFNNDLQS